MHTKIRSKFKTGAWLMRIVAIVAVSIIFSHVMPASAQSPSADLSVTVTVDNATPNDGGAIVYTIVATNNGPDAATGVSVNDLLPLNVNYVSDDGASAYDSGSGIWTIGGLAATTSVTLHINATVALNTDGDTIINTISVSGVEPDPNPANNSASATIIVRVNDLCAASGSMTLPGIASVTIWGYTPGDCTRGLLVQAPGGPTITANQGDTVNLTLHNNLVEATGLYFQGQVMVPDRVGAPSSGAKSYTFIADHAGTYLYEAGLVPNTQHQVAIGLYGVLIVRPATLGQAYDNPATAYNDEAVVVLSEIDPLLNNNATPATFDLRKYKPKYRLINGQAYPNTAPIPTLAGNKVLLRYANAGLQHHSMALLGLNQTVVAMDGSLLAYSHRMVAETIAPGQTADVIATVPSGATAGSKFALYDGNLLLHNSNVAGFGGMLTFLEIAAVAPGTDTVGPTTNAPALLPNPTNGAADVTLNASVSDVSTGGSNIQAAEYFIDTIGANGSGTPLSATDSAFDSPTETVIGIITMATLGGLSPGNHTIHIHGQDSVGNWGTTNFAVLNLDKSGPATSGLVLNPNPSNGTVNVILTGSANDSATGNSNIVAAEYFIGAPGTNGSGVGMTLNTTAASVASLNATLTAATINAMAHGSYVINVHSQDMFGNWGSFAQIDLKVDKTGPTTSDVSVAPNPNNGTQGSSPTQPAVQVDAMLSDVTVVVVASSENSADGVNESAVARIYLPMVVASTSTATNNSVDAAAIVPGTSYVKTVEGFIDTVGANGSGFLFTPNDGLFDSGIEAARALIPLTTITLLSNGNHTIYVHGQDGAGNWGATIGTILLIDKAAPTFTGITLAPNPIVAGSVANTTLTVNGASDNAGGTGITGGEYWFGTTDPAPGSGTAFSGLNANIPVGSLAPGTYTVRARLRDGVGNWSTGSNGIRSVTLTVTTPPFYFSTTANSNPPGAGGTADDADIYFWNGTAFSRVWDASANGVPGSANVDGLVRVDATHFYLSFAADVILPVVGTVQDEDVVFYNAGVWSVYFDGTARGLTAANQDLDAFDIVGSILYFSTVGNTNPPGVGGGADDADIYSWNGISFSRVFDASANGLPGAANTDGLSVIDASNFYLSFNGTTTTVTGIGAVQDEDIVRYTAGVWSVRVDGTALGLTNANHDLDAIDIQ